MTTRPTGPKNPCVCIQPASLCPQFADVGCGDGGGVEGVASDWCQLLPGPCSGCWQIGG